MNNSTKNRLIERIFKVIALTSTVFALLVLLVLLVSVVYQGAPRLSVDFMMNLPSRIASKAGILPAWTGTLWIFVLTALFSIPLGIGAAIYLEEYGKKNRLASIIEINIANLAGIPSIIYGLLGLGIFVRTFALGEVLLAGAFTLTLLILPIIIVSTREALRAVPDSVRQAAFALGATKWQTIWTQVLPGASGSIMTGIILALARAVGETAPLIVVGALAYVPYVAKSPMDEFTVLPMQIFNWVSRPQHEFAINAAAAIIVLLVITFLLNGIAVYLRNYYEKKIKW